MTKMRAQYAIIRYIPNMLREEFINVGVLLVCPEANYQGMRAIPSFGTDSKVKAFEGGDGRFVRHAVTKLKHAVEDHQLGRFVSENAAPEGLLTFSGLASLSASYHNNIQLSEPRPTVTTQPEETLEGLFQQFVTADKNVSGEGRVTRQTMRKAVYSVFREKGLFDRSEVQQDVKPPVPAPKIDLAYRNNVMHYYHLIPFTDTERTYKTVQSYRMTANDVRDTSHLEKVYRDAKFAVLGYYPPKKEAPEDTEELLELLHNDGIETLNYTDAPKIAQGILEELHAHDILLSA